MAVTTSGTPLVRRLAGVARPSAPAGQPRDVDAWKRLEWVCHAGAYAAVVAATALALRDLGLASEGGVLALVLTGVWLGWFFVGTAGGRFSSPSKSTRLRYFLAGLLLFAGLLVVSPWYFIVAWPLLWESTLVLGVRRSLLLLGLTVLVVGARAAALGAGDRRDWFLEVAPPLLAGTALFLWIRAIIVQSRERRELIDALEATRRELGAKEREAGMLEERQRLAGEIHDTLAQGLVSVVTHLEAAGAALDGAAPPQAGHHLEQAEQVARRSLEEARRVVWALRPKDLEGQGLAEALRRLAAQSSREYSLPVRVEITGEARAQPPEFEVTLLRATQEALSNVGKHAEAREVTITVSYLDGQTILDVQDDGRGFDPREMLGRSPSPDGGIGLQAMRERVARLSGSLSIETEPGRGSTLVVALPLADSSGHR